MTELPQDRYGMVVLRLWLAKESELHSAFVNIVLQRPWTRSGMDELRSDLFNRFSHPRMKT